VFDKKELALCEMRSKFLISCFTFISVHEIGLAEIREHIFFLPDSIIGQLCEDLNKIAGRRTRYDRVQIQNTKWLWFVSNMITALNNNKRLCGCFEIYQVLWPGFSIQQNESISFCSVMNS